MDYIFYDLSLCTHYAKAVCNNTVIFKLMQNTRTVHVPYHSPIDSSRVSDNFRFLLTGGYHYKKKDRLKIDTCK